MGDQVQPIYVDLASESDDPHVTVIDSLCVACHQMGSTRLLMTRIPHYKEVIITSFSCPHCSNHNTGFQPGRVEDQGVRYQLTLTNHSDLSRQVVRSDQASITIPELELEIPGGTEKGEVTTVEGIVRRTIQGLSMDQAARRQHQPQVAQQIDNFLTKLHDLLSLDQPFTLTVDDPSGNSFVENPAAPHTDPHLKKQLYVRTPEQAAALGLAGAEEGEEESQASTLTEDSLQEEGEEEQGGVQEGKVDDPDKFKEEVLVFSSLCDRCSRPANTNMKVVKIPHFKEVIIMALHCDGCGYRTNEVKSGAGISPQGLRITLRLAEVVDLARDVLKSDTCAVTIPELELHVGGALLGGRFTTVEGLLVSVKEDLQSNPFLLGDSATTSRKAVVATLLHRLEQVIKGQQEVTLILDDPAGNSYLQSITDPEEEDPRLQQEQYKRSPDQDDDLGLTDMKTEHYTTDQGQGEEQVVADL